MMPNQPDPYVHARGSIQMNHFIFHDISENSSLNFFLYTTVIPVMNTLFTEQP